MLALIADVRERVQRAYGVTLENEVVVWKRVKTNPTQCLRRGGRAGIVPAGSGDRRRAEVSAQAKAGGYPQEETRRKDLGRFIAVCLSGQLRAQRW